MRKQIEGQGKAVVVADMHNDLAGHVLKWRRNGMARVMETMYLDDMRAGGVNLILCAIFLSDGVAPDWTSEALAQIEALYADVAESSDHFALCRSCAEMDRALDSGRIALLLGLEGGEPVTDLAMLRRFRELGVRFLGLTHKRPNALADGCTFTAVDEPEEPRGRLSAFGAEVVAEAAKLGMAIDLSHLGEEAFMDVLALNAGPVFASHTNAQAVNGIRRNFSDAQIRAVAKRGGLIGMNGYSRVVHASGKADVRQLVDHIDHCTRLVGWECVGLGIDLFAFFNPDRTDIFPDVIKGYKALPQLTAELTRREYTPEQIAGILGANFVRFLRSHDF